MQAVLVMFRADGERRSFSVTRDMTVIGRREDCDLRIPLGDISRKHCRLVRDGDSLKIEDLGSSNGTYLNGQRVQEAQVSPGDSIQLGPVVFVLQIDGVPADDELSPITVDTSGATAGSGVDDATDGGGGGGRAGAAIAAGVAGAGAAAAMAGEGDEEPVEELEPLEELEEEAEPLEELEEAEPVAEAEPEEQPITVETDAGEEPVDALEPLEELEGLEQDFDITEEAPAASGSASGQIRLDIDPEDQR